MAMPEQYGSIAQYYHERTKYDPETIAAKGQGLDWSKQPSPFKEYKIGTVFDLKPYLQADAEASAVIPGIAWWQRLSHLLLYSYGITAKVPTMIGQSLYLRSAPSAGSPRGGSSRPRRSATSLYSTVRLGATKTVPIVGYF